MFENTSCKLFSSKKKKNESKRNEAHLLCCNTSVYDHTGVTIVLILLPYTCAIYGEFVELEKIFKYFCKGGASLLWVRRFAVMCTLPLYPQ